MSGIATGTALLIGGGLAAGGSVASGIIGSNAASNAADTQAQAAEKNAQLQAQMGQEQLGYEAGQYANNLALETPLLNSGYGGLANLDYLLGIGPQNGQMAGVTTPGQTLSVPGVNGSVNVPGINLAPQQANTNLGAYGSLMSAYPGGPFQAPTAEQARQTPGYQFGLEQGEGALQASAAARGDLLTGGTMNALDQYAQNYADTNYNNVYNQALQNYQTNYNTWANQNASEYNKLASLAGLGQTTAQQLSNAGLTSANQVGQTLGQTGNNIAQQNTNAAAATASGYIGSANALGGAINGATGSLGQLASLYSLMNQGGGSSPTGPYTIPNLLSNPTQINNYGSEPGYINPLGL